MPVFSLSEVRSNQIKNYENTFEEQVVSSYGYYMGGLVISGPYHVSDVDRIDFSTDTVSFPHYHPQVIGSNVSAFQDSKNNYGYFIGGLGRGSSGTVCAIDRMDFVNETWSPNTYLVAGSNGGANTFNSEYGYIQQGPTPLTNYDCDVIRISFSDSTGQTLTDIFPQHTSGSRTLSSQSFGYFVGGNSPAVTTPPPGNITTNVFKLNFSNETIGVSPTPSTYYASTGFSGHLTLNQGYGYIASGYQPIIYSTIERLDTSNDNVEALSAVISGGGSRSTNGCTQSKDNQYFALGWPPDRSTIDRFDYSTETNTTPGITLQRNKSHNDWNGFEGGTKITRGTPNFENWNESATYGYTICRLDSSYESNIDRIDMATEVTSLPGSNDASNSRAGALTFSSNQYGYGLMGNDSSNYRTDITRIDFISETSSGLKNSSKAISNYTGRGTQNNNYGYGSGGNNGSNVVSTTVRFDFNTESFSELTENLGLSKSGIGQLYSESYGYFAGGQIPGTGTDQDGIDKFDFSTESMFIIGSRLNTARDNCIGNQSNSFGYFAGGVTSGRISNVDRIDLSTDTTSTTNNLTGARDGMGSNNTLSYGYWLGGNNPSLSPNRLSIVNRIDFETETISNPGNPMGSKGTGASSIQANTTLRQVGKNNRNDSRAGLDNQGRNVGASYGYFIGGENNASYLTRNDRVDMLNETVSQVTNAPPGSKVACITASAQRGYHILGENPGGANSNITRIDLTNETFYDAGTNFPIAITSGKPYLRNTNYAYINKGASSVETLDFETETFKPEQFHNVQYRSNSMNASTPQYGYVAGGTVSDIERLDFVSESRTTLNANLPTALNLGSGINQTRNGDVYFVGADNAAGSQVSRFSIATETISNPGNPLTKYHALGGATQNENYGYLAAGYPFPGFPGGMSTMARIEFENDTTSNPGNLLTQSRYSVGSLSNGF